MMTRGEFLGGLAALPLLAGAAPPAEPAPAREPEVRRLRVPFDHARPGEGGFDLEYFVARPFDRRLPTVMVLGDGQQFYIRRELWADWDGVFGEGINVVGLAGRGFAEPLQARVGTPAGDGWTEAYRLLNYRQWIADADLVRRDLAGPDGKVLLYGASGGGQLVHQYLTRYGRAAERALTRASVFPWLDAEFGLSSDRFWGEIQADDRATLSALIARHPERRADYARLFQRQNFFVPPGEIDAARRRLTADLAAGNDAAIARLRADYQLDAIDALMGGPVGAAIRVRLFEFFAPQAARFRTDDPVFRPDLEVSAATAGPLLPLWRAGRIPTPSVDIMALHQVEADVLMVAGRRDHTSDYRSQIALACCYPRHKLLLLDDNHNFDRLDGLRVGRRMMEAWRAGLASPQMAALERTLDPLIWREN